jgi:hypothetical protein
MRCDPLGTWVVVDLEKLVLGFQQSDRLARQHFTREDPLTVSFQTSLLRDAALMDTWRMLQFRQAIRAASGRGHV